MKTQDEWIQMVGQEVIELLKRKNADYGDAFAKRYEKHGILSAFIRMEDKWLRLDNLLSGHKAKVTDESVYDTVFDFVGYGILTLIELLKERERESE
ncbi:nucleotide modification associated domain-containing protein [Paenibacillus pini]|uniref:Nucleotide modification associated domain-containing protein n=1 Tax=Paenibacillus pini JCM 16418 TaxID=1236976 RepID=W7YUA8_9BACL|nr:nucleotide modification associated domain-containing protein [Paenibacillus pini]GAF10798.1 hypothetical protein JCM16418_5020 [Paenibacillus pini JCM 16418]